MRNHARDELKMEEQAQAIDRVIHLHEKLKVIHEQTKRPTVRQQVQNWCPPDEGWIKANSDGATSKSLQFRGGGAILRNYDGSFHAGACHFFPSVADQEMAELLACRGAIRLAMEVNVGRLYLEIDSQAVVSKIQDQAKDYLVNGHLINEIKSVLLSFWEFKVGWVRRSANSAAHILAR
jgi:ribonuclease HI